VVAWGMLQITCRRYSRNAQAAPPAWLHPAMVQLADAVLQRPGRVRLAQGVITQPLTAASAGASPMANPRLCAAAGRQADPSIGAQVAAAVQQVRSACCNACQAFHKQLGRCRLAACPSRFVSAVRDVRPPCASQQCLSVQKPRSSACIFVAHHAAMIQQAPEYGQFQTCCHLTSTQYLPKRGLHHSRTCVPADAVRGSGGGRWPPAARP
jgi:hypothetical protein